MREPNHLKAVSKLIDNMNQLKLYILHYPSRRNNLLAQGIQKAEDVIKPYFIKATLEE